jgi:hypothetical protein
VAASHPSTRPSRRLLVPALAALLTAAAALALAACGGAKQDVAKQQQAIGDAITEYLRESRGIRSDAMKMEIRDLRLDGEEAHAKVRFTSPGAPDGMEYEYHLRREAGAWKVLGSSGAAHGQPQTQAMPEGHPSIPPEGSPPPAPGTPATTQGS